MVSFRELRDARPATFDDIAEQWGRLASQLTATAGDLKATTGDLDGWRGDAGEAARGHVDDVRSDYDKAAEYLEKIPPALRALADAITDAKQKLDGVLGTVEASRYLTMNPETGEVTSPLAGPGDHRSTDERERDRQTAADLTTTVNEAVGDATDADRLASSALDNAMPESAGLQPVAVGDGNVVSESEIPADASPEEVKRWWDSLSPMEQEAAIYAHGDVIGGMDGVPVADRDRANRVRFAEEYTELQAQQAELEAAGRDDSDEYERLSGVLRGMEAIDARLDREPAENEPATYLIDYSTEGRGQGVVATGNPDTADNVVTSVPGTGAELAGIGGELGRGDVILAEADSADRGAETAAVTWVGYDAPQDLIEATQDEYAKEAADELRDFQDGLRATHEGSPSNNTVIGHSYGSTVIGHSAQGAELDVDNVVFLGSPGVGVDHASDLEVPDDANIYASTAENDMIRGTPPFIHGPQPIGDDFGATTFTSDPGTDGPWYQGGLSSEAHSEYWQPESASLRNLGKIAVGAQPS